MELSEYFSRIFPSTAAQMYYPSRKNNGIFVSFCFIEAGSNYFSHKQGDRLKSDDVPLERKLYDGSRKMSPDLKDSFKTFNEDGLCAYFEKIIDKNKYGDVMLAFGIPPTAEKNPQALRRALAVQFKAFIDSDKEDAADIVAMTYQQLLEEPEESPSLGTQTWRGRKLYLSNHDEIRPRAESNCIEIPETPPKTGVEISVVIELRPFEGRTTCHWIMVDSDDNDCYPGSRMFDIDIDVKFKRKNS